MTNVVKLVKLIVFNILILFCLFQSENVVKMEKNNNEQENKQNDVTNAPEETEEKKHLR